MCSTLFIIQAEAAKMYKWEDPKGNIYFSDKVPPKDSVLERSELDEKGRTIAIKDAAKTLDQIVLLKKINHLQETKKAILKERLEYNKKLILTYQKAEDLDKVLNGKVTMLNTHIKVAEEQSQKLKIQLINNQKQAATFERSGKPVPDNMLRNIEKSKKRLDNNFLEVQSLKRQVSDLTKQFKLDKERFKKLDRHSTSQPSVYDEGRPSLNLGELNCVQDECAQAWEKASLFIRQNSGSKLIFESPKLLLTSPPTSDQDMALSLTMLKAENKNRVFLDIRCKNTLGGRDSCQSSVATKLITTFNTLMEP
ncbi:MAG: hypothetical protein A6F71_06110 [Cycloclasticus sp. symbiont of Poecilosclerida sp. M]|nr:MAG: hypothetical protein A6F71_06110 [Cycloclasticus sp. symbiont of Poecilosclerida sp. M]